MEDEAKHNIIKLNDDLNNLRLEVLLEECPNVDQILGSVANVSKTPIEDEIIHNIDKLIDDLNYLKCAMRLEVSQEEYPNVDQILDSVVNVGKTLGKATAKVVIGKFLPTLLGHKSKQIVAKSAKAIVEIAKTDQGSMKCTTVELIRALIDLLKEDDIDILTQACSALGNICHDYLHENGKNLVKERDGLKLILTVLKKGIALHNVEGASFLLIEATHLLFILLEFEEALCIKALEEGMLPILCSILELDFQNGMSNDEVLEYVCETLKILDEVDIEFLDERLARGLVNVMMDIPFDAVTGRCLEIFRGQAWKDEKARLVLAKAGVREWLQKLLQKHHPQSNDEYVQCYLPCIRRLLDLITGVGDVRARL